MDYLNEFNSMINSYGGRDKVLKALCYSTKLVAGILLKSNNGELSKKFSTFSSKVSGARATLRLIDDFPMIQSAIEYGLGEKENDKIMSSLGVFGNIIDLLFYPIEKICWFSEHELINIQNPGRWDTISSTFWVISIYLNLIRTLKNLSKLKQNKDDLKQQNESIKNMEELLKEQRMEILTIIRLSLDFVYAVQTLPAGYLWGKRLSLWQSGLIGTFSAILGIYQFLKKRKLTKNL